MLGLGIWEGSLCQEGRAAVKERRGAGPGGSASNIRGKSATVENCGKQQVDEEGAEQDAQLDQGGHVRSRLVSANRCLPHAPEANSGVNDWKSLSLTWQNT